MICQLEVEAINQDIHIHTNNLPNKAFSSEYLLLNKHQFRFKQSVICLHMLKSDRILRHGHQSMAKHCLFIALDNSLIYPLSTNIKKLSSCSLYLFISWFLFQAWYLSCSFTHIYNFSKWHVLASTCVHKLSIEVQ